MSKLFITNDVSILQHTISINQEFFPKYLTFTTEKCSAVFYEKKNYSLGNSFRDDAGNFIGIVGTYVYKECFGVEAARRILTDFDGDVVRMKKEVQGMFSALICKAGQIVVFNDYYGFYDTFFHVDAEGNYIVATSLKDALVEIPHIAIDEYPFMMEVFCSGCFDEHTPIKDVWKLRGGTYLRISSQGLQVQKIEANSLGLGIVCGAHQEDVLQYLKQITTHLVQTITKQFSQIALCATGGLDSRTLMATYAAIGASVHLLHGQGNSLLTATCPEDARIVTAIASKMGWPCSFLNWKHPEVTEGIDWNFQKYLGEAYGFSNRIYVGNRNFLSDFCDKYIGTKVHFVDFGYNIEALRLRSGAERLVAVDGTLTLEDFVYNYYLNVNLNESFYPHLRSFEDYVLDLWRDELCSALETSGREKMSLDSFERLRWADTRYSGTRIYMLMNMFAYSFPLYCVPSVQEVILSLPAAWIKNAKFQIAYIRALAPQLLEMPIFSHRRKMRLMRDGSIKMDRNMKNIMTHLLPNLPFLSTPILDMYRRLKYKDYASNQAMVLEQLRHVKNEDIDAIIHINDYPKNCVAGGLYQLRQFLIVYNLVKGVRI